VLSRIAESLFWIGRYVERADDTARILDVLMQQLLEDPWVDEDTACRSLLSVMGASAPPGPVEGSYVLAQLAFDPDNPSAITGALCAARENARGARETISSEMWESLNSTWVALPRRQAGGDRLRAHGFFLWVRERAAILAGLVDTTMSRDEGWLFIVLGRSLERADMTARLLMARAVAGGGAPSWALLLRSCGAYETFLRTYRGALDGRHAAEFLLLDRLFPRSVFFALSRAETCLNALNPATDRSGVADDAQWLLGRARTNLEFRRADELLAELPQDLEQIERTCSQVSEAISRRYFPKAAPATSWSQEAVS